VVGVSTVLPQAPKEHFLQHSYCCMEGVIQNRWQTLWVALTWRIWHYRNRLVFSNEEFDGQKVLEEVVFFCWLWLKNMEKDFEIPFHVWTSNIKAWLL